MHRKRGALDAPRIVAGAKETACTRVISSPYRITESAEIPSCLNPLLNPALLGFQSVEIQASFPWVVAFSAANRLPPPDQVRGHASPDNALTRRISRSAPAPNAPAPFALDIAISGAAVSGPSPIAAKKFN